MAINWVISDGKLFLLYTEEDGTRSPLIEFEEIVCDFEDANEVVQNHREEIIEICNQYGLKLSDIGFEKV